MANKASGKKGGKGKKVKFSDYNTTSSKLKGGSKAKRNSLSTIRESLMPLLVQAREAIAKLSEEGLLFKSEAYQKAMRSARQGSDEVFSIEDKHRFRELKREASRLTAFLSDPEISSKIVNYNDKVRSAMEEHGISFQNQKASFAESGNRFNVDDQERMKLALRIFRDIASTETAVIGKEAYGSDNLINLIYDELEGYDPEMNEEDSLYIQKKAHDIAFASIQEYKYNTLMGFLDGSPREARSSDVNIVESIKKSQSAEEFYNNNPYLRRDW